MRIDRSRILRSSLTLLAVVALSACVDEEVVYVQRDLFQEPPEGSGQFLGYTDHQEQLVVCGNCHVDQQGDWKATAHASAWATLEASGSFEESCASCHTVNELGNPATEPGGYHGAESERYEDVQCESCHGPALPHVQSPSDATAPLALLAAGVDEFDTCGACHTGVEQPYVEEWSWSQHGDGAHAPQYRTRGGCMSCHSGKGALVSWGGDVNFAELDDPEAAVGISCATCHEPHSDEYEHQLRYPLDSREPDEQLCMRCHQKRSIPEVDSPRGPHSPQGPLLLGEIGSVGWTPPNFAYDVDRINGSHGGEANLELCATCHMNSYTVTDASGEVIWDATGHSFEAIPCVDEREVPTGDDTCPKTNDARSFDSCTSCHGTEQDAFSAYLLATDRIDRLVAELEAQLAQVPDAEFNADDDVFTVAEGARFNAQLGAIRSSAVHNPFLMEALLTASIDIVAETYGVTASPGLITRNIMWEISGTGSL